MKKLIQLNLILALVIFTSKVQAQGEGLFKAKCNTCHLLNKNSTGPNLKGAKQKWQDAGEGDLIYDWVKNPPGLIASGKSKMAAEVKNFSPTDMTPQAVSNEEIDQILDYVDTYVEPTIVDPPKAGETAVVYTPNYKENLSIFYWLLGGIFIELIAIIILSNAVKSLIKSDYFQTKLAAKSKNSGNILKAIIIIISFGVIGANSQTFALSLNEAPTIDDTIWLHVEKIDLYILVTINLILIGVILYLKNIFKSFLKMVQDEKKIVIEEPVTQKLNKLLTDVVPIEQEHEILLHHEYDGIRELDNNLPPWWVWGFVGTVIFAIVYLFNYHVFKTGDLQYTAYNKEIKKADKEVKAYLEKMAMNVDETNATLLTDGAAISAGKAIFTSNCVTCHNPDGEGNIGPNLTDKSWIYGFDIKDLFKTVKLGTPNGMPEHASKLNPVQIQQVSSYILQLPEKKGKEPEGTFIEQ